MILLEPPNSTPNLDPDAIIAGGGLKNSIGNFQHFLHTISK